MVEGEGMIEGLDKELQDDINRLTGPEGLTCPHCSTKTMQAIIISPHVIQYQCVTCGRPYIYGLKQVPNEMVAGRMEKLEKLIGQPPDEHTKPLFDIVVALSRELQDITLRVDRESKKLQDEIERRQGWIR